MRKPVTATCLHCGKVEVWDHDKSLDVACPHCGAEAGHPCKRPSEHETFGGALHRARTQLAFDTGAEPACECQQAPARPTNRQLDLFEDA